MVLWLAENGVSFIFQSSHLANWTHLHHGHCPFNSVANATEQCANNTKTANEIYCHYKVKMQQNQPNKLLLNVQNSKNKTTTFIIWNCRFRSKTMTDYDYIANWSWSCSFYLWNQKCFFPPLPSHFHCKWKHNNYLSYMQSLLAGN